MTTPSPEAQGGNLGKWDNYYRDLSEIQLYADATTYLMAAAFLSDVEKVEDWGCGKGGFRLFFTGQYFGIDGSNTPFADKIENLCEYKSSPDGILVRHVLEHNYEWNKILAGAVASFRKKLCLVLFTPFAEKTMEIAHYRQSGLDVPDLSLSRRDIEAHFSGLSWRLISNIKTDSQYGSEHVYLVWKNSA